MALAKRLGVAEEGKFLLFIDEALSNILRHSKPKLAVLVLSPCVGAVRVLVCDDGRGFDSVATPKKGRGLRLVTRLFPSLQYERKSQMNFLAVDIHHPPPRARSI